MSRCSISIKELKEFVREAKRFSFAGNGKKTILNDNSSMYSYKKNTIPQFIYTDIYNGNIVEGGRELVSINRMEIWKNQYYGGLRTFKELPQDCSVLHRKLSELSMSLFNDVIVAFLKKCLLQMPEDFPLRGPSQYILGNLSCNGEEYNGNWKYQNHYHRIPLFENDDIFLSFTGFESISVDDLEVYWHSYNGGLIIDKNYEVLFDE
jgi:hypothetical protein